MNKFTDEDDELLKKLGRQVTAKKTPKLSPKEQRVIAGFCEIQDFYDQNGRIPQHDEGNPLFEKILAIRLEKLYQFKEKFSHSLEEIDRNQIFEILAKDYSSHKAMSDDEMLLALGAEPRKQSLEKLKFVRHSNEISAAESVADRKKCQDFSTFEDLFQKIKADLESGIRKIVKCTNKGEVEIGNFYILYGQILYVADQEEAFIDTEGRNDRRLRIIFDNQTESNMLRRSLQKRLWEDDTSRRIIKPNLGPIFDQTNSDNLSVTGTIYVLRSNSKHPDILKHRNIIHKIGFTTGEIKRRIGNPCTQPSYLLSEVEVVSSYKLLNVNPSKLESLIHKIFENAKLDIELMDRFGKPYKPREWFLVPLSEIKKAIDLIASGEAIGCYYNLETSKIEKKT
jgi:hypothetical protein